MSFLFALVLLAVAVVAAIARRRRETAASFSSSGESKVPAPAKNERPDGNHKVSECQSDIEPLPDFDWRATPPMKLRPFKPTYNITMAIQTTTPSDLITIDSTYLSTITARRAIIKSHTATVLGATPAGHAPLTELYTYLLGVYLPTRYPSMFTLLPGPNNSSAEILFHNKITGLHSPLHPPPSDPSAMLRVLGETVEDDLFLLVREPEADGGEHRSVAVVCCHPAGFDPSAKLGKRLVEIHGPVPGYEKIGRGMERLFARLEVGRGVKRVNWSVQTHTDLFAPSGNHIHAGEHFEEDTPVDVDRARLRVELQTLTRLPETQAILFSFKSYLYPLADIKAEGLGPQLADAIQGLKAGNAPGMWVYKGGVRWGRAVCEYLRE